MQVSALTSYLAGLHENNAKGWFVMNKPAYDILREEFTALVAEVALRVGRFDPVIVGVDAKKAQFRIYRDVRFAKDKTPYKTSFSASLVPGGRRGSRAPVYYFAIDHTGTLRVAAGCYLPDRDVLQHLRQAVSVDGDALEAILKKKAFKTLYGGLSDEDQLVRAPKGFAPDDPHVDLIRRKSLMAVAQIELGKMSSDALTSQIVSAFKTAHPLVEWLRAALQSLPSAE